MTEQQKEIETIKSRKYMLKLSDADVERLAKRAGQYNLTAAELLENFIGDLIGGTYSNGSDERDFADRWAERCWFALEPDKNLIAFLCGGLWYDIDGLMASLESINDIKADIEATLKEIEQPERNWKDFITSRYDESVGEVTYKPTYSSLEEYIADLENELADYREALAYEEEQLDELKKEFAAYMGDISYTWEAELEAFLKWREASMPEAEEETADTE